MKVKKSKIKNSRRGLGLPLAVVIVVILAVIGLGLIQLGLNARLQAVRDVAVVSARTAADAGIEHAVRYMIDSWNTANPKSTWVNTTWYDAAQWDEDNPGVPATALGHSFGSPSSPILLGGMFGDAGFWYSIYKSTQPSGYQIISTGTAAGQTRTVHAAAVLKSAFFGVGAKENINMNVGSELGIISLEDCPTTTSCTGLSLSCANSSGFVIQTNSTIRPPEGGVMLRNGLTVPGDVVIGAGGDTDVAIIEKKDVFIEGDAKSAEEPIDFPSVYPPDFSSLPAGSSPYWTVDPNNSTIASISSSMKLNSSLTIGPPATVTTLYIGDANNLNTNIYITGQLDLNSGAKLIIIGNVTIYVTGNTNLGQDTRLIVEGCSTLKLYLGGNMYVGNGAVITYAPLPVPLPAPPFDCSLKALIVEAAMAISIKGTPTCKQVTFKNSGGFFGTIYAPDAEVTFDNSGTFYGAVVGGSTIDIKDSTFMYIPDLFCFDDVEVLYMGIKHGSWWE